MLILPQSNLTNINDYLSPINKNQIKKLIREELAPTWFESKSATPDMSWVAPTVLDILFSELITHTHGNQSKAARILGVNRGNFSEKLKSKTIESTLFSYFKGSLEVANSAQIEKSKIFFENI